MTKQLHQQGVEVEVVVGFATKEAVILEEELSQVAHVTVTTDDGTYGTKGYVSTVIDQMDQSLTLSILVSTWNAQICQYQIHDHPCAYISMESRMAWGWGLLRLCSASGNESQAANKRVWKTDRSLKPVRL